MTRGKAWNRWKTHLKYISRLKKHMYYWLVQDGEKTLNNGRVVKIWRKPKSWKELDEKGGHSKLLRDTPSIEKKAKWEKVDDKRRIKSSREEGKKIIDEELNNIDE